LPIGTKVSIAQSLMLSILDYADVCYPDLSGDVLSKLIKMVTLLKSCESRVMSGTEQNNSIFYSTDVVKGD
jgi:hypothetical protein